ncbi:type II toxin-antitoxin system RelE/ParE family toxin [Maritalea sp.]|uniref:type II toxin-antitoxin system RelE/ParE family toxin n=1 Tax=Maritalea sp. TaxID=2003361 RepID=UPI003EF347AA
MKRRSVEISEGARRDLFALYDWIANAGSPNNALAYVERIKDFCTSLDLASERGTLRDDVRPNLRTVGFERSATIAFIVEEDQVVILRIFYAGRNWTEDFGR